ncbi:MAG TPA: hypothetical protein V6D00_00100 [Pantanalinema sp.]
MRARSINLVGTAILLASLATGCTSLPTSADALWAPGASLGLVSGGGGKGDGEVVPVTGTTTALFQTDIGPIAWKGVQLARLLPGSPKLCNAPSDRYGRAIAIASDASVGWAAGAGIVRYETGTWELEPTDLDDVLSPTKPLKDRVLLTDLSVASASAGFVGYAVGTKGAILRYDAPQRQWTKVAVQAAAGKNLGSVKVLAADDVWVAGEVVMHFDGKDWTAYPDLGIASGLAAPSSQNVWLSTAAGLYHFDADGWTLKFPSGNRTLGAPRIVAFGDTVVGMAVESGVPMGEVYTLTQTTWALEPVAIPKDVALDTVVLADAQTAYAKSYDNSGVWKYDLAKRAWSRFSD